MKEKLNPEIYQAYVNILQEELVPAMGCTEPIALAYAAALARQELGCMPQMVTVAVSANIIKNVKSVVVPHTGGLRGIQAAVAAGTVAGDADRELEVLAGITEEQQSDIAAWRSRTPITVTQADSGFLLDIDVTVAGGGHTARVRLVGGHTNVVRIEKDGEVKLDRPCSEEQPAKSTDRGLLSVENIITFADQLDPEDVREVLQRQIDYNTAIAEEGLRGNYGANIGSIFLQAYGNGVHNRAKALAAAGSDARMNGCELPVVINSGSGNQGLTVTMPVLLYAEENGVSHEKLLRALAIANLMSIHQKRFIGSLSAYCGATSAACAASVGVCWMQGGSYEQICGVITNTLATLGGMWCDGAKSSCASKIAAAVYTGLLSVRMSMNGHHFEQGEGIVTESVEKTIEDVGYIAREGMKETDLEILRLMLKN